MRNYTTLKDKSNGSSLMLSISNHFAIYIYIKLNSSSLAFHQYLVSMIGPKMLLFYKRLAQFFLDYPNIILSLHHFNLQSNLKINHFDLFTL